MLSLQLVRTNNDPIIPAYLYLSVISDIQKCPSLLRTDCGSETGLMASIQCFLQQNIDAHRFGKSVANQRIENFWSHLKRTFMTWIIEFFKDLVYSGIFSLGNYTHAECAWFVFSSLIQDELDKVVCGWNMHCIRKSRDDVVGGIPDELFHLPEAVGYADCGSYVPTQKIQDIIQQTDVVDAGFTLLNRRDDDLVDYFNYLVQN